MGRECYEPSLLWAEMSRNPFSAVFFSHEMPWMRSGIEWCQFLRVFLPTLAVMLYDKAIPKMYWH